MDLLLAYLQQYISLNQEEIAFLQQNLTIKEHPKNELLFQEGNISRTIYFVSKGLVRLFYTVDGLEKTAFFYTAGKFICAGESFTYAIPAKENYQTIETATIIHLDKNNIEKLLIQLPQLEIIGRMAVEEELITAQKIIASFVTKSPTERYLELLDQQGELFQRAPQQYIASYLGVSPETLSRIKKRITPNRPS
ncbi:MAG: Crp/Fnr family transcriptional regulator [Aureispira sp.]